MTNNDILKRLRYMFDFKDHKMASIFAQAEMPVPIHEVTRFLIDHNDEDFLDLSDHQLAGFLNGLINNNRGKREGVEQVNEDRLTNNQILVKLKIALELRSDDIVKVFDLVEVKVSEHEISSFLRNPKQRQYRPCKDQYLRNFLMGLQIKYRPKGDDE